jgi:hypothetical protein
VQPAARLHELIRRRTRAVSPTCSRHGATGVLGAGDESRTREGRKLASQAHIAPGGMRIGQMQRGVRHVASRQASEGFGLAARGRPRRRRSRAPGPPRG